MKFVVLGYFASFLAFLGQLNGENASKIKNGSILAGKFDILSIREFWSFWAKIPEFSKCTISPRISIYVEFC